MNRIVLIGNGFDLAHGMPTRYQDFLDDFWKSTTTEMKKENPRSNHYENNYLDIQNIPYNLPPDSTYKTFKKYSDFQLRIEFKNRFLKIISEKTHLSTWVDLEDEYYALLKNTFERWSPQKI
ncbi:MAG: AbiH family protein [Bacteroidales bacterium]|nr:AbiH family protein [Bacteroidales bacterium]